MIGPSRGRARRLGRVLAALGLVALVASCTGAGDRTFSSPSGTDAPDRQSSSGGGGGHGSY